MVHIFVLVAIILYIICNARYTLSSKIRKCIFLKWQQAFKLHQELLKKMNKIGSTEVFLIVSLVFG